MTDPRFDAARFTAASRQAWSDAARDFAEEHAPRLEPYGLRLLELLEIDHLPRGATLLDLASGPGDPALEIAARLAGRGTVIGTDLAPEMVAIARERAERAHLGNVEFQEVDAQALPFEAESFDRVTCRFGIMLMADPTLAAREAARVLVGSGRFGFTVWSEAGRTSPLSTHQVVTRELVPADQLPPSPDVHALGSAAALRDLAERSGLEIVTLESFTQTWRFRSVDHFWSSMTRGTPYRRLLEQFPPAVVSQIERETRARLGKLVAADGSLAADSEALIVVTRKRA